MSKTLAVFGATGRQGSSVISNVLGDPELSQEFKLRAITRDVDSAKAKELKSKNVQVVYGDVLDRASLNKALAGSHTVFAMTAPVFGPGGLEAEYNAAKAIADAAVEQGVAYFIFSTLPHVSELTGGKYTSVTPFDAKAKAEAYIRGLPIKSAFYSPSGFMENYQPEGFFSPVKGDDGTYVVARQISPKSKQPLIDATSDTGKFVGAILAEPDKYEGKTFCAATEWLTPDEIAAALSKSAGVPIVYKQISTEEFRKSLPPPVAEIFASGFKYMEEFGYWGPDSEKLVDWAIKNARGKLTTFEEYLEAHPFRLP